MPKLMLPNHIDGKILAMLEAQNSLLRSPDMDIAKHVKDVQSLHTALRKLHQQKKPLGDYELAQALSVANAAAKALDMEELRSQLNKEDDNLQDHLKSALERRREQLHISARNANVSFKRFESFDRVAYFKVNYKSKKVSVEIGSELVSEFSAVDGEQVFSAISELMACLESTPFSRKDFFLTVKDGIRLAREHGRDREGWVPVRLLYVHVALLRNLQFEDFVKKPSQRSYRDYSSAQFVFDMARFGKSGWSCDGETLRSESPNMATVAAGKAMTLPNLDELDKLGHQFARIRIERGAADGTQGDSGEAC
jgi:hypothetical protein